MRRKLIALFGIMSLALSGVVLFPEAATASDCVLTAERNPSTGTPHRLERVPVKPLPGVTHEYCYKLGVHGTPGGVFYFHLEVQDLVVRREYVPPPAPYVYEVDGVNSCVEMQWQTPGTSPWVTQVRDCNSADWLHDGWLSPMMHPIANGVPTSFAFRIRLLTHLLIHENGAPRWRTIVNYPQILRVDY